MPEVKHDSDSCYDASDAAHPPSLAPSRLDARRGSAVSFSLQQQQLALNQPTRKTSRLELVEGPAGVHLQEVPEDQASATSRKGTLNNIGQIPTQLNKREIDKHIKTEVAHHSAAVADTGSTGEREAVPRGVRVPRNSVVAFILQHLHLAVASPVLFRIPYLVAKHSHYSGSAFLLVYVIMLFAFGAPLYVLEASMAQYSSLGPIHIYRCLPLFAGVGVGMLVICFLATLYCSTVISWTLIYVLQSFYSPLPWKSCPPDTGPACVNVSTPTPLAANISGGLSNITYVAVNSSYAPAEYYFRTTVTDSLNHEGSAVFDIELPFLMLFVWSVVFVCILARRDWHSGITSWMIGLTVYVMLFIFFLEGLGTSSGDLGIHRAFGLNYTLVADDLEDPTIWVDALGQVFWSLGVGIALHIMSSSHNGYTDSIFLNSSAAILSNLAATLLVALAFFPFVGEMRSEVADNPGFLFVISSFAVTYLTIPQLASFVFYTSFGMTLTYHMVTLADTVLSTIAEVLHISWRRGFKRMVLGGVVCLVGFSCSIWFSSSDGIYLISCLDAYLPWLPSAVMALLEVIAFAHCYGSKKILLQMKDMSQAKTSFVSYWKFVLPPVLPAIQIWAYVEGVRNPLEWMETPTGRESQHEAVGLALSVLPVVLFVAATFHLFYMYREDTQSLIKPRESWGPALVQHKKLYTQDVLRATRRVPWLVLQSQGDLVTESCAQGWIPTGYTYIPEGSAYVLMSANLLDDVDEAGRRIIVSNFLKQKAKLQRQQSEKHVCTCEHHCCRKSSSKKKRLRRKRIDVDPNTILENETPENQFETNDVVLFKTGVSGGRKNSIASISTCSEDYASTLQVPPPQPYTRDRRSGVGVPNPSEVLLFPNGLGQN